MTCCRRERIFYAAAFLVLLLADILKSQHELFDRSLSGYWRSLAAPHVELAALHALAKLLDDADTSSQSGGMSAALISHEASRKDVHAKSNHDISVRSILEPAPRGNSRNAAMAGVADLMWWTASAPGKMPVVTYRRPCALPWQDGNIHDRHRPGLCR